MDKEKHLTFWENDCDISLFKKWCHTDSPLKNYITNYILQNKFENILDAGCGTAHMYHLLKPPPHVPSLSALRGGAPMKVASFKGEYTGTDITEKFVNYNVENGISCVHCGLDKLPFASNSFDCTLCIDTLNHQLDFKTPILELLRVSSSTVILSFFKEWKEKPQIVYKHDNLIYHHFNLNEVTTFLEKCNVDYDLIDYPRFTPPMTLPTIIIVQKRTETNE